MCTVFRLGTKDDRVLVAGQNYDTPDPCFGSIFINPRGLRKHALMRKPESAKTWESRYGSVAFSRVSREFPSLGMNEARLVVTQTTLWNTVYPDRDDRPAVKELQLIQFMLDTCATTGEVLGKLNEVRIAQEAARIQCFVCGSSGDTAVVEFILGKETVFGASNLPYPVIANDMYETSMDYLRVHRGYGGEKELSRSPFSIDRFAFESPGSGAVKDIEAEQDEPFVPYTTESNYRLAKSFFTAEPSDPRRGG